jgi:hypothetical protein
MLGFLPGEVGDIDSSSFFDLDFFEFFIFDLEAPFDFFFFFPLFAELPSSITSLLFPCTSADFLDFFPFVRGKKPLEADSALVPLPLLLLLLLLRLRELVGALLPEGALVIVGDVVLLSLVAPTSSMAFLPLFV